MAVWEVYQSGVTQGEVITEALCLIGDFRAGEMASVATYERGIFHLKALMAEFPTLNQSQMAHKLAERLEFHPMRTFLQRLRYLIFNDFEQVPSGGRCTPRT